MKNIIIDILWYLLNKLDPLEVGGIDLSIDSVTFKFKKRFFRKNRWEHAVVTLSAWVKNDGTTESISELGLWRNGKLSAKELYTTSKDIKKYVAYFKLPIKPPKKKGKRLSR